MEHKNINIMIVENRLIRNKLQMETLLLYYYLLL